MTHAIVTGGNRGIGKAIAAGLVAKGIGVTILARDAASGAEAAAEIGAGFVQCDLATCEPMPDLSGADILVNNAGVLFEAPLFGGDARFDDTIDVMLRAPYRLTKAVLPHMRARGAGHIVNLSSGWGSFAENLEGPGAYGIAKAALNALTFAASREAGPAIKVNACCPGWVHTRMGGPAAPRTPEEGADTPIWLATLPPDGPTGQFFRDRQPISW